MRKIAAGIAAASAAALAAGALAAPAANAADGNKSSGCRAHRDNAQVRQELERLRHRDRCCSGRPRRPSRTRPSALLTKGDVALTAFIPNDKAFQTLVKDLTGTKPSTEKKTFAAVAGLGGIDLVETVLLYHVVPGATIDAARPR